MQPDATTAAPPTEAKPSMVTAFALYCKGHTLQQVSDMLGIPLNTLKAASARQHWVERRDDSVRARGEHLRFTLRDAAQDHVLRSVELSKLGYDALFNFLSTKPLDMLAVKQCSEAAGSFNAIARQAMQMDDNQALTTRHQLTISVSGANMGVSAPAGNVIDVSEAEPAMQLSDAQHQEQVQVVKGKKKRTR